MTDTNATTAPLASGFRAHYRIRVAETISPDFPDRLGGLQITTSGGRVNHRPAASMVNCAIRAPSSAS